MYPHMFFTESESRRFFMNNLILFLIGERLCGLSM